MATILLGALGASLGASVGGALGASAVGAMIGKAVGSMAGNYLDQVAIAMITPDEQVKGPHVDTVGLSIPREGEMLPRGAGWQKLPGRIMWPEVVQFDEEKETTHNGGKGAPQNGAEYTEYYAEVSIALAIHDGNMDLFGRVWADGSVIDLSDYCDSVTWYHGTNDQDPDPLMEAAEGAGMVPDYRGVSYVVLNNFDLRQFGNRVPQLHFECYRSPNFVGYEEKGICLVPGSGEFALDTKIIRKGATNSVDDGSVEAAAGDPGAVYSGAGSENSNALSGVPDLLVSLDLLKAQRPNVTHITIPVVWFGSDLRADQCLIQPRVDSQSKDTNMAASSGSVIESLEGANLVNGKPDWEAGGISRGSAPLVSDLAGVPVFGGSPSDASILRAIQEIKARGYSVTLLPIIQMDIPAGNALVDPYGAIEQESWPRRNLITCTPAIGQPGTVDQTVDAATQISAFVGSVTGADFARGGDYGFTYNGPQEWSFSRFILHMSALAGSAGLGEGDAFLVGYDLAGLTVVRDDLGAFPFVDALQAILSEVRTVQDLFGDWTSVSAIPYAAYTLYQYMPQKYRGWPSVPNGDAPIMEWMAQDDGQWINNLTYSGIDWSATADNENGDLFYSNVGSSIAGVNFFGFLVDLHALFGPNHGGFTARFQCKLGRFGSSASIGNGIRLQRGGQNDVEDWNAVGYMGDRASTPQKHATTFGTGGPYPWEVVVTDELVVPPGTRWMWPEVYFWNQRHLCTDPEIFITGSGPGMSATRINLSYLADWKEYHSYKPGGGDLIYNMDPLWSDPDVDFVGIRNYAPISDLRDEDSASPYDTTALKAGVESGEFYDWEYITAADRQAKMQTAIVDPDGLGKDWVARQKDFRSWWQNPHHNRVAGVEDESATSWAPSAKKIAFVQYGAPAVSRASNQPEALLENPLLNQIPPHFSDGARDDDSQAAHNSALVDYWADTQADMVDLDNSSLWGWDARPWPVFPHADIWPDAVAWPTGHWVSGRGQVKLRDFIQEQLEYYELPYEMGDVLGSIDGVTVDNFAGFNAIMVPIFRMFNLDSVDVAGKVRVNSRLATSPEFDVDPAAVVPLSGKDRWRAPRANAGSVPRLAMLTHLDIAYDYSSNTVTSFRDVTGRADHRTTLPLVIDPQLAEALLAASHVDAEVALDTLEVTLPPSAYGVAAPGKVFRMDVGQGLQEWIILQRDISTMLALKARRLDRSAIAPRRMARAGFNLGAVSPTVQSLSALMDLPMLRTDDPAHDLRVSYTMSPAQDGAVLQSTAADAYFNQVGSLTNLASMGVLFSPLAAGAVGTWDRGNAIHVFMVRGELMSKTETEVFNGENLLAVRSDATAGDWELIRFQNAELVAPGEYRLTKLLRGQRGSQVAANIPAGAQVVVLDDAVQFLGLDLTDVGLPKYWAIGPVTRDRTDPSWRTYSYTPRAIGLRPFAPVHLAAEYAAGDLVVSWVRQDRSPLASELNRASWPMSETSLDFQVTVEGVALPYTANLETITIPAADLPALPFDVSVAQVSAETGPGYVATITME